MTQYPMVSSGGWQCGVCGAWVPNGVNHFCPRQYFPPQYYGEPTIIQHTDADCIKRAKELLPCTTCGLRGEYCGGSPAHACFEWQPKP